MIGRWIFSCVLVFFTLPLRAAVIDIDNTELARLTASGVPLVDIRTAEEWRDTGLIAGSRLITFVDDHGRVDVPNWLAKIQSAICRAVKRSSGRALRKSTRV